MKPDIFPVYDWKGNYTDVSPTNLEELAKEGTKLRSNFTFEKWVAKDIKFLVSKYNVVWMARELPGRLPDSKSKERAADKKKCRKVGSIIKQTIEEVLYGEWRGVVNINTAEKIEGAQLDIDIFAVEVSGYLTRRASLLASYALAGEVVEKEAKRYCHLFMLRAERLRAVVEPEGVL